MRQTTRILITAIIALLTATGCVNQGNQPSVPPTTGIPVASAKQPDAKPVSSESEEADEPEERRSIKLPSAVFADLNGKKIRTEDLHGKLTLVVYWATWCPPCRHEIPTLVELRKKYSTKNLEILAVSQDDEIKTVKNFIASDKLGQTINYTVMHGVTYTKPFGLVPVLPTMKLIGKDGKVIGTHEGMASEKALSAVIEKYL